MPSPESCLAQQGNYTSWQSGSRNLHVLSGTCTSNTLRIFGNLRNICIYTATIYIYNVPKKKNSKDFFKGFYKMYAAR